MDLTITGSTNSTRGPISERKNVAGAEKQLESMGYRLTQERGIWPFLTSYLEKVTDKTDSDMGASGGAARDLGEKGNDSGDVCNVCE